MEGGETTVKWKRARKTLRVMMMRRGSGWVGGWGGDTEMTEE